MIVSLRELGTNAMIKKQQSNKFNITNNIHEEAKQLNFDFSLHFCISHH